MRSRVLAVIGRVARPRSVTSKGREMPAWAQAEASSEIRPTPNLIDVGYDQLPTKFMMLFSFGSL